MNGHLEELKKEYQKNNLVPFIGSGLSVPFEVPTWGDLVKSITDKYAVGELDVLKQLIEIDLSKGDYWQAIDTLKNYAMLEEADIQSEIVSSIQNNKKDLNNPSEHNYLDLKNMKFNLYLTTNYENLLQKYLDFDLEPILLKDIDFNTQNLFTEQRVLKLHGTTSNSGTLILSKQSYEELYQNNKYNDLLKLITGTRKLIFIGFSFDDQFIRTMIEQHKDLFKGKHYIILDNPSSDKMKDLKSNYNLTTIPYDSKISNHTEEIRKLLNQISEPPAPLKGPKGTTLKTPPSQKKSIHGVGLKGLKRNLNENLFFKKLKLENISDSSINLSSLFYIAAEEYIRELNEVGMGIDVIDLILGQVYIDYQDKYHKIYQSNGDSEEFLQIVHASLEKINLKRYAGILKADISNKNENKGFVHVLTDTEEHDLWWGEARFDGTTK